MRPLVLQLQEDLVKGVKKTDELLRFAKLIAGKLQVDPLEHWIEREMSFRGEKDNGSGLSVDW